MDDIHVRAQSACDRILVSAKKNRFLGYDPYDALNSVLFQKTPLADSRLCRLAWTQLNKRFPVSLRKLVGIPGHTNPKCLALFLSGVTDLMRAGKEPSARESCIELARMLERSTKTGYSGACWGYPFAWQARAFFLPLDTPTVVATTYVGNALLDAHQVLGDDHWLQLARSACEFILRDLNRNRNGDGICFSYSPIDRSVVHNASILGARLLARVAGETGEAELLETAMSAARFTVSHQRVDGAWGYGTAGYQKWVDNFHTGFLLECLSDCHRISGEEWLSESLCRGFDYYRRHLFLEDGQARYFDNSTFPLDAHAFAQALVTLTKLDDGGDDFGLAKRVAACAFKCLWHPAGYFCYQQTRLYRNQIKYLRWADAWMFRGLASLVSQGTPNSGDTD